MTCPLQNTIQVQGTIGGQGRCARCTAMRAFARAVFAVRYDATETK